MQAGSPLRAYWKAQSGKNYFFIFVFYVYGCLLSQHINVCVCGEGFIHKFMCSKVKIMCLLWAQRTNQLSRHLIDKGQSNVLWLIRMLYSYQTNLFLAITIVYGNQGMFWSSLSMRPPAPADELVLVNSVSKEFMHLEREMFLNLLQKSFGHIRTAQFHTWVKI